MSIYLDATKAIRKFESEFTAAASEFEAVLGGLPSDGELDKSKKLEVTKAANKVIHKLESLHYEILGGGLTPAVIVRCIHLATRLQLNLRVKKAGLLDFLMGIDPLKHCQKAIELLSRLRVNRLFVKGVDEE